MSRGNSAGHLDCVLCLDRLKSPRILPCFHSFCLQCLDTLIASSSSARFACPTCRQTHAVPERGALGFQNNFYIEEDSVADENDETDVLDDRCQHHTSEHLRFYCTRCRVAVCRDCKLTSHKGHATVDVTEEMGRVKTLFNRVQVHAREVLLPALLERHSSYATAVDAVASDDNVRRLKTEITLRGDALKKAVDESVRRCTQALERAVSKIKENDVVEEMNKQIEDLSCLCDYFAIVLSQGSQKEVLSLPTQLVNFVHSDINNTDGLFPNPPRPLPAMSSNDDGPAALIDQLLETSDPASLPKFNIFAARPPRIEMDTSAASRGTEDVPSPDSACVSQQNDLQSLKSSVQSYVGQVRLVIDRKGPGLTRHVDPDCEANTARPSGRQRQLSLPNIHPPRPQQQQTRCGTEQQPQNTVTSAAAFDHRDVNRSLYYPLLPANT